MTTYNYKDKDGTIIYRKVRKQGKAFFVESPDGKGGWTLGLNGDPSIYNLPEVLKGIISGEIVFNVEGEKDADNLSALGLTATTTGSATSWQDDFAVYYRDAHVCILPDKDTAGRKYAQTVANSLQGKVASIKIVNLPDLLEHGDITDWINAGHSKDELIKLISETKEWRPTDEPLLEKPKADSTQKDKQLTQAQQLIELAIDVELFKDSNNDPYATIQIENHRETYPVKSVSFKHWLVGRFYNDHKKSPSTNALSDALTTLAAKACYEGQQHDINIRLAEKDGIIYLDLANEKWEVVEIMSDGWQVKADTPVKFIRSRGMLPLPYPVSGGSILELKQCINYPSEDGFTLIIAWLVAALRPNRSFPILALQGEQGSAKTTTARILRSLIDPNSAVIRSLSRNERELIIAAGNSWIQCFDNLSGIPFWVSDVLCRLSTGGGFSVRELYSDREEILFDAMRPIILNGIDDIATRQDLIARTIVLILPTIQEKNRQLESEIWNTFKKIHPKILGSLLDGISTALRRINEIKLSNYPRMADFTHWVTAAESAFGYPQGSFIKAYTGNRIEAIEIGLEADQVAIAIRDLMKNKDSWQGTATELLDSLNEIISDDSKRSKAWPKAANKLSSRLRRLANGLREIGIVIDYGKGKERYIELKRNKPKPIVSIVSTVGNKDKDQVKPLLTTDDTADDTDDKTANDLFYRWQQNTSSDPIIDNTDDTDDKKQALLINQKPLTPEQLKQKIIKEFDAVEICNVCDSEKQPHPKTGYQVCPRCHPIKDLRKD